jgi:hypothetical protein
VGFPDVAGVTLTLSYNLFIELLKSIYLTFIVISVGAVVTDDAEAILLYIINEKKYYILFFLYNITRTI